MTDENPRTIEDPENENRLGMRFSEEVARSTEIVDRLTEDIVFPGWVSFGHVDQEATVRRQRLLDDMQTIREEQDERLAVPEDYDHPDIYWYDSPGHYPPPERRNAGAAAGIVFMAAIVGTVLLIVLALYLVGQYA